MKHRLHLYRLRNLSRLVSISLLALTAACSDEDESIGTVTGKNQIVTLSSEKGTQNVKIKSNAEWTAKIVDCEWAWINSNDRGTGDGSVNVSYKANITFPRKAALLVTTRGVADTIELRQYGITPIIEFDEAGRVVSGAGADVTTTINTNLPQAYMGNVDIVAVDAQEQPVEWIYEIAIAENLRDFSFKAKANADGAEKKATIRMKFTDDWGKEYISKYEVTQNPTGGTSATKEITFEELKAKISEASGELLIEEDLAISGIVISDYQNENVAETPHTTQTAIDYDANFRTAYLQNRENTHGVRLSFDKVENNTLRRWDGLKLWVKNLTLVKESLPERYTLKSVLPNNYISIAKCDTVGMVRKEVFIDELTDNDIYTFATLKRCEFPIREGSYTPLYEGYTAAYGTNRTASYPMVVRDIKGGLIHLITNVKCPYRRDGSARPLGSGSLSGVIVHERYTRFEEDGYIGDYQIRHLAKEDIALAADANKAFSKVLAEWTSHDSGQTLNTLPPSTGSGSLYINLSSNTLGVSTDYSPLGPIVGVESIDDKGRGKKGAFSNVSGSNWWWSGNGAWMVKFSTLGINETNWTMNMLTYNENVGAPRYFTVEYCTDELANQWTKICEYTVPDITQWGNTLLTQLAGTKNISIDLPAEISNKRSVIVRMRVEKNIAGTGTSYAGGTITASKYNSICYLSVRYHTFTNAE